ncbi:DUF3306 domain-containing protein [Roseovarius autotrophicus]|uniref:DUF3306 domain-containing protein n=1 Tax=Roseovarius autotrophicus TaxID=2824121 RepID=UPI001B36BFA6|nr:DUF3306 domain-containing protein [Roseovarius autotrophicus]
MSQEGDFWSRRKARVEAEAEAEARASEAAELTVRETRLAEKSDEELCEELGLPDPDTLGPGDDFRAFMARAVPERLRRRALRRLWLSNPVLANLDGMIDYGEDFTDSSRVIENLQTAYQVGKGMLAHVQEMARQAEAEAAEDAPAGRIAEPAPVAMTAAAPDPAPEPHIARASEEDSAGAPDEDAAEAPLPPRRRMRFAFDDSAGAHA